MSCPNRCSNNFKVKDVPDQIDCVVADKIKSNEFTQKGLPVTNLPEGLSSAIIPEVLGVNGGPLPDEPTNSKLVFLG